MLRQRVVLLWFSLGAALAACAGDERRPETAAFVDVPAARSGAAPENTTRQGRPSASVPAGWARHEHAGLGLAFAYPRATFRLTETPTSVALTSSLARDELGGDPEPKKHVYSFRAFSRDADATTTLKQDHPSWFEMAFPKGTFDETNGSVERTRLAGLDGYRLTYGVEGYDTQLYILARGSSSTIVLWFDTIGDVMSPTPTEDDQLAVFETLRSTLEVSAR